MPKAVKLILGLFSIEIEVYLISGAFAADGIERKRAPRGAEIPRKALQPFGVALGYYRRYLVRLLCVVGVQVLRWIQTTKSPTI